VEKVPSGGDLSVLRQLNEEAVLRAVRAGGSTRVAGIAERTGLARASVEEVVRGLVARGWLVEEAPVIAGRGRPARRYRFRAEAGYALGLDIGAYNIRAVVADLDGTVLASAHTGVAPGARRVTRLSTLDRAVRRCLGDAGVRADQVWAAVAGSTGWIDPDGRVVLSTAIPDWAGVNLVGHLRRTVGGAVLVENDSKLAALAEHRRGAATGASDVIVLHAGWRTGIGLVIGGRLHRGSGGAAGDFSRLPVLRWESATEILRRCPSLPSTGPTGDHVLDVIAAAGEADPAAVTAVRAYVHEMAMVAAATVSVVDPELLVLAGSLSRHADVLLPVLADELAPLCLRPPELRASALGADSVALGGACLALEHLDTLLAAGDGSRGVLRAPAAR
jgi:predicted NBD/HSP70 family sugar kinase